MLLVLPSGVDALLNAPETAMAGMEFTDCRREVGGVKVRPPAIRKDQFCVGALPEHEVAQALFAAGADQQIELGNRRGGSRIERRAAPWGGVGRGKPGRYIPD